MNTFLKAVTQFVQQECLWLATKNYVFLPFLIYVPTIHPNSLAKGPWLEVELPEVMLSFSYRHRATILAIPPNNKRVLA
jgi:hypothetical protein